MHYPIFGKSSALSLVLSLAFVNHIAAAEIDSVDHQVFDDRTDLIITFSEPLGYLSHSPQVLSDFLSVNLSPLSPRPDDSAVSDEVDPPAALAGLVTGIRYDGATTIHRLILDFSRPTAAEVLSEAEGRRLRISLPSQALPFAFTQPPAQAEGTESAASVRLAAVATPSLPALSAADLEQAWQEARASLAERNYGLAIQRYKNLLERPAHQYTQLSQEYLGLAFERNDQEADAKAAYETYLKSYPDGNDAKRVRQRLAGLVTARATPQANLRPTDRLAKPNDWDIAKYGSLSAFYIHGQEVGNGLSEAVQSDVLTDADYTIRARNDDYDIQAEIAGDYAFSLIDTEDSQFALSSLNLDAVSKELGLSGVIGRQRKGSHGIFSRFDGAFLGYEIFDGFKLNGFSGALVDKRSDGFQTDRYFYGSSLEFEPFGRTVDVTIYGIQQEADGVLDRQAIGTDMRFVTSQLIAFGLVDYDLSFGTLNVAQASGTWLASSKATANLSGSYRKTPFLTTSNALLGDDEDELADLLDQLGEDAVRDLAEARTPEIYTVSVGGSFQLTDQLLLSGDITTAELSDTDDEGDVLGSPGSGTDIFYSTQLAATNLLTNRDITNFGIRFADTGFGQTLTGDINMRISPSRNLRLSPRLRADYRLAEDDRGILVRLRPSLGVDYRLRNSVNLLLELGGEWANEEFLFDLDLDGDDDQEELIQTGELFALIGARWSF